MPEATTTPVFTIQPSAEAITLAAEKICKLIHDHQLTLDIAAGRVIVDTFYSSDLALWNKRNTGDQSLESLAKILEERDPAWTAPRLYRAVRFYEQWKNLGNFEEWPKLMPTHFLKVQGLPWDRQRELLTAANAEGWTVARLVEARGARKPPAPGAPVASAKEALRELKVLERGLGLRDHVMEDLSEAGIAAESSERLLKAMDAFRAELERVRGELASKAPAGPTG